MSAASSKTKKRKALTREQKDARNKAARKNRKAKANERFMEQWAEGSMRPEYTKTYKRWVRHVTRGGRKYYGHHMVPPGGLVVPGAAGYYAHPENIRLRMTEHYNPEIAEMVVEPSFRARTREHYAPRGEKHSRKTDLYRRQLIDFAVGKNVYHPEARTPLLTKYRGARAALRRHNVALPHYLRAEIVPV